MAKNFCINCMQQIIDDEVLCVDCRSGNPEKKTGTIIAGDLDKEILISALRHDVVSKDIVIQRLMFKLVELTDKLNEVKYLYEKLIKEIG